MSAKLTKSFDKVIKKINQVEKERFNLSGEHMVKKMKAMVESRKTGREYWHPSGKYVASAPGEAPASPTDALLNSIEYETQQTEVTIGTKAPIMPGMEFGKFPNIAPRPLVGPAFRAEKKTLKQIMGGTWF